MLNTSQIAGGEGKCRETKTKKKQSEKQHGNRWRTNQPNEPEVRQMQSLKTCEIGQTIISNINVKGQTETRALTNAQSETRQEIKITQALVDVTRYTIKLS